MGGANPTTGRRPATTPSGARWPRSSGTPIAFLSREGASFAGRQAPVVLRLVARVAQRFSIQVTEKAAAQALPVVSAASAAAINVVFIDHFQDMATGHFIVRKLERKYGPDTVKELYAALPSKP